MPDATGVSILGYSVNLFWVGVIGSLSVEVAAFAGHYDTGKHPEKYKKFGFYLAKATLAFIGGALVVVYGVTTAPAALQIGASASALVLALAKREPVGGGSPAGDVPTKPIPPAPHR